MYALQMYNAEVVAYRLRTGVVTDSECRCWFFVRHFPVIKMTIYNVNLHLFKTERQRYVYYLFFVTRSQNVYIENNCFHLVYIIF